MEDKDVEILDDTKEKENKNETKLEIKEIDKKYVKAKIKVLIILIIIYIISILVVKNWVLNMPVEDTNGFGGLALAAIYVYSICLGPIIIIFIYNFWKPYYKMFAETKYPVLYSMLSVFVFLALLILVCILILKVF